MPKSLFLELETSKFGYSHVFLSQEKWEGQILPNLMFRIQKRHLSGTIPGKRESVTDIKLVLIAMQIKRLKVVIFLAMLSISGQVYGCALFN